MIQQNLPYHYFQVLGSHPVVLAAGLVSGDTAENFNWLFQCWIKCMGRAPNAILTDQCKDIAKAIEDVFPQSSHRLCLFHLLTNTSRNLGKNPKWMDIQKWMSTVVHDSMSSDEFEEAWAEMVHNFNLEKNSWIMESYAERKKWVPCYCRETFWAGMSSTQRSEGVNFFFKGYLNVRTGLKLFIEQFEKAIAEKVEQERKLNIDSSDKPLPCDRRYWIESVFSKAYTNSKFKEVKDQVISNDLLIAFRIKKVEFVSYSYS